MRIGFETFVNKGVRRLATGIFAVRSESQGSYLVESKEGRWVCDCGSQEEICAHVFAAQLSKLTNQIAPSLPESLDESLRCRYCGSPDLNRCGYRYNATGVARRYFCNGCRRKFSVKYMGANAVSGTPSELLWLLNEIGLALARLNDLLAQTNSHLISTSGSS